MPWELITTVIAQTGTPGFWNTVCHESPSYTHFWPPLSVLPSGLKLSKFSSHCQMFLWLECHHHQYLFMQSTLVSVHGSFQAIMLEWGVIAFSSGSSWPRNQTQVSCIADRFFSDWGTRESPIPSVYNHKLPSEQYFHCIPCILVSILIPRPNYKRGNQL